MDISYVLAAGQRAAEDRMTDTCRIGTWTRTTDLDEHDNYVYELTDITYEGKCEYNPGTRLGHSVDAANQLLFTQYEFLKLPMSASKLVGRGQTAIITASATDPAMPGTRVSITGPYVSTYSTARRFPVEVVA